MPPFDSLILGIVEGFTEFLPISSTAHLTLASHILGLDQSAFVKSFEIAIQSGAILAVIVIYWRKFLDWEILKKVIAAFIPTAIIGYILYSLIKSQLIGNLSVILWALGIGGVIMILFEIYYKKRKSAGGIQNELINTDLNLNTSIKSLSYTKAGLIGLAQAVAVIPGVSRSAATIIGGMLCGMSRVAVVEFSFLLAVPTIGAATLLDLYKNADAFSSDQTVSLIIGFVAAFVTAIVGIKFLLNYVKGKSFIGFGVYRIVLVVLFILIFV